MDLSQNRASRQIDALLLRVLITAMYPRVLCNAESVAGAYTVGDQADEWTRVYGAQDRPPRGGVCRPSPTIAGGVIRTRITRTYVALAGGPSRTVRLSGHVYPPNLMGLYLGMSTPQTGWGLVWA